MFTGSPPHEAPLAAHRPQKSVVIRLVEKLHSADNPAEIAHGFPVPKVENKHTPVEYLMKGLENIANLKSRVCLHSGEFYNFDKIRL